ncbi:uncharacterized protein RHOBADRAFT_54901 [Rhodotorula graminis WP1]|uniref:Uncharacterized protein n=1 Tax=Rhodotorula graminis (strain WP1) TaxID=578459 RepID=A0A0P9EWM3_RHOGW|nr:uncharacterized protein RHOBADRAFT_54901 [Rhodotorula graminis WP1]KPV73710.1 hypothetical protein RHOBADRAFT_54901 [Rhodotorula graminis WP1]
MSTSGVSRSWTPGTERRYATTTAPSSTGLRLTRGMKAVLLLALLAVLIVAIVPAAVVSTRDNDKKYRADDHALGYTTVVDGVTTFIQTRTASIVTRSSYRTLDNGDVSTVQQVVTLPIITEVIVATVTRFVAGANAFVTRTLQGELGAATVYRTVFDDLTVVRPATSTSAPATATSTSASPPIATSIQVIKFVDHHRVEREIHQLHRSSAGYDEQHRAIDELDDQYAHTSSAVEREQQQLVRIVDLEQLAGASSAEQQHHAVAIVRQYDAASRSYDPQQYDDGGIDQHFCAVAAVEQHQLDPGPVLERKLKQLRHSINERVGRLPVVHAVAFSSTFLDGDRPSHDEQPFLKRSKLVHLDGRLDDADRILHPWTAALPRRLRHRRDDVHGGLVDFCVVEQICVVVDDAGLDIVFLSSAPDDDRGYDRIVEDEGAVEHERADVKHDQRHRIAYLHPKPAGHRWRVRPVRPDDVVDRHSIEQLVRERDDEYCDNLGRPHFPAHRSADRDLLLVLPFVQRGVLHDRERHFHDCDLVPGHHSDFFSGFFSASTSTTPSSTTEGVSFTTASRTSSASTPRSSTSTEPDEPITTTATSTTSSSNSSAADGDSVTSTATGSTSPSASTSTTTSSTSSASDTADEQASSSSAPAPAPDPAPTDDLGGVVALWSSPRLPPASFTSAQPGRRHRLVRRHREQPRRVDAVA